MQIFANYVLMKIIALTIQMSVSSSKLVKPHISEGNKAISKKSGFP